MGKWVHILSNIDLESKTAICAYCGNVKIRIKDGRPKCRTGNKEQRNKYHKSGHGLTLAKAAALRENGLCAICGSNEKLVVDHCHETNRIRGILCSRCNLGLGYFRDNPTYLSGAISYLNQPPM